MNTATYHEDCNVPRRLQVPIEGPKNAFCDNEVVCKSATKTVSVLIQKQDSIAYQPDRKTEATDYSCVQVRDSHDSVGPIYEDKDGNKEGELVRQVTHWKN